MNEYKDLVDEMDQDTDYYMDDEMDDYGDDYDLRMADLRWDDLLLDDHTEVANGKF